jgi:RNA polymerase sigma-70 factor (ECF subfamily)
MDADETLLARSARGDRRAFDELYRRHVRHLVAFASRYVGSRGEAEEVAHDVFVAALQADAATVRHVRAWLFTAARNRCLHRLRARQRSARAQRDVSAPPTSPDPATELASLQADAALTAAVAALPARLGDLYRLRASGLSYRELADALDVPLGTVKSRMHELVAALRAELHKENAP